jgi:hypothetical protein
VKAANGVWKDYLNCIVFSGSHLYIKNDQLIGNRYLNRLVIGASFDGRAIIIYADPGASRWFVPRSVRNIMRGVHERGGIVGIAKDLGDAWDIIVDNPKEYKRKPRTYYFLRDSKQELQQGEEE